MNSEFPTQELQLENHYLKQLIQLLPGDLYIKDKKDHILVHNEVFRKHLLDENLIDDTVTTLVGKNLRDLFPKTNFDNFHETDQAVISTKLPKLVEETTIFKSGDKRKYIVLKMPLFGISEGEVDGIICYLLEDNKLKTPFGDIKLSDREMECLAALFYGMTAKQAAQAMDISYRTVEIHMNNMKNKIGCIDKSSVIEFVKLNGLEMIMDYHYNKIMGRDIGEHSSLNHIEK